MSSVEPPLSCGCYWSEDCSCAIWARAAASLQPAPAAVWRSVETWKPKASAIPPEQEKTKRKKPKLECPRCSNWHRTKVRTPHGRIVVNLCANCIHWYVGKESAPSSKHFRKWWNLICESGEAAPFVFEDKQ